MSPSAASCTSIDAPLPLVSIFFSVFAFANGMASAMTTGSCFAGSGTTCASIGAGADAGITVGSGSSRLTSTAAAIAGAGRVTLTAFISADACSVAGSARMTVTRVSRVPISVTSSAVTERSEVGRLEGMVSDAPLAAPVRSMMNWLGCGL